MNTRGQPFLVGSEHQGRRILKIVKRGIKLIDYKYRVLNLTCGHESVLKHSSLQDVRKQSNGCCLTCTRALSGRKFGTVDTTKQGPQPHPDRELHLEMHRIWNRSLPK